MEEKRLTVQTIQMFERYLIEDEKSDLTREKYLRDVRAFLGFAGERAVTKELTVAYKEQLIQTGYAPGSINSMLASINSLFRFLGWENCRTKNIRVQKKVYCSEDEELTKEEYIRLAKASGQDTRLRLILEAICGTGIRVSELSYFTVEAVREGEISVACKNKIRTIIIPGKLRKKLLRYARKKGIAAGIIFRTRNGNPVNRSNIWAGMKRLCEKAKVAASKVYPHSLRKLFARTFYRAERDIARLADILGHSSIDTTRIYIMSTGTEHRRKIERLGLIL